jgi:hypothetical protein
MLHATTFSDIRRNVMAFCTEISIAETYVVLDSWKERERENHISMELNISGCAFAMAIAGVKMQD